MLYSICIGLILVASVLVILAVLVQSPKSGMAANFGASNQVMGVRETTNFLEKFTWTMAIAIVVLSLVATLAMDKGLVATSNGEISKDVKALQERVIDTEAPAAMPAAEIPAEQPEATDAAAQPAATTEAPATAPAK
ncbi:MAG: preprotein translocase subunit SecG [Alistipes sp.]